MNNPQSNKKTLRRALVVTGMHRSGTSALTGTLNLLGYDLPCSPMRADEANEKGYFESNKIYRLNDEILDRLGSRWDDWNPLNLNLLSCEELEKFLSRAASILKDEFPGNSDFLLKDPRLCRMLPFWLQVLEAENIRPLLIHTLRNPLDVASSLFRRDGLEEDLGLLIWLQHTLDFEWRSRHLPRIYTSFERLLSDWQCEVAKIHQYFELSTPRKLHDQVPKVTDFLSSNLAHFSRAPEAAIEGSVIDWVRETYAILHAWAATGDVSGDYESLDRIRHEVNRAAQACSVLVVSSRSIRREAQKKVGALQKELDLAKQEMMKLHSTAVLREQYEYLRSENQDLTRQKAYLEQTCSDQVMQNDTISANLSLWKNRADTATARVDAVLEDLERSRTKCQDLSTALLEKHTELTKLRSQLSHCRQRREKQVIQFTAREERLYNRIAVQQNRANAAEFKITALETSNSWRLTVPLRAIIQKLRRNQ